jgi:quercetin dioxygenase-like cupin family protein
MAAPAEQFNLIDSVWCKQMHFAQAGDRMDGHLHTHNHLTLLAAGKLRVVVNGVATEFTAPHMIFIHKDHTHELTALVDNTVAYCIHAVRDADTGDIIDDIIVPAGIVQETLIRINHGSSS